MNDDLNNDDQNILFADELVIISRYIVGLDKRMSELEERVKHLETGQ